MSRLAIALAAGAAAIVFSVSAMAAGTPTNHMGIPIAPGGGTTSLHQWGGIDDAFAVNPDGDEAAAVPNKGAKPGPMAQSQGDESSGGDDSDDPGVDPGDEVLAI